VLDNTIRKRCRRRRDRMVVGFKTTYVISDVVSSNLDRGEVYSLPHYEEKFVSDLRQVFENGSQMAE
jgi:hypothetical protein